MGRHRRAPVGMEPWDGLRVFGVLGPDSIAMGLGESDNYCGHLRSYGDSRIEINRAIEQNMEIRLWLWSVDRSLRGVRSTILFFAQR
jgi:hypothetical protein